MYKLDTTKRFDKALKLCKKRGYPIEDLRKAIAILAEKGCLPKEYKATYSSRKPRRRMGGSYKSRLAAGMGTE